MAILLQGLVLLVSGMGIVFLFLTLLVWVMNRSARIIPKFNHILPDAEPKKKARPSPKLSPLHDDNAIIALVIAAAKSRVA